MSAFRLNRCYSSSLLFLRISSENLLTTSQVLGHQQASWPSYNNYITKRFKKSSALAYRIQLGPRKRINKGEQSYFDFKGEKSRKNLDMGQDTMTAKARVDAIKAKYFSKMSLKDRALEELRYAKDLPSDCGEGPESLSEVINPYVVDQDFGARYKTKAQTNIALAKIKYKEGKRFQITKFATTAQKKYIDLNNELQQKQITLDLQTRLQFSATRLLLQRLREEFKDPNAEVYWRFCKALSRPTIVQAVLSSGDDDKSSFAQITVKMHTEQIIALRDRQKRLVSGSLQHPVHATEFIVLERFLHDPYGYWRICEKIHSTFEKPPVKSNRLLKW